MLFRRRLARRPLRYASRIAARLMAFHLLLVIIPIGGILYLGIYEQHVVEREYGALTGEASLFAAEISRTRNASAVAESAHQAVSPATPARSPVLPRFRVVDARGNVVADSGLESTAQSGTRSRLDRFRRNPLYAAAAAIGRPLLRLLRLSDPPLEDSDPLEHATRLNAGEVAEALHGRVARARRFSDRERLVVLDVAVPIIDRGRVTGAVVAEESTAAILGDLAAVRLGVLRIFVASVVIAILITLYAGATIVRPLRQLRREAAFYDRNLTVPRPFTPSRRRDEIGDLSRSLDRMARRLTSYARFIENFAVDLSHELKNPLASVRGASEMLGEIDDPAEKKRFRRMIEQDIARMEHLLDDIREITSIDTRLLREPREAVNVAALIEKIIEGARLREHERVRFAFESVGEAVVRASEPRLLQVFENMIENAVSFSPDGATIHIDVESAAGLIVRIRDEGPGIPPENLARIFDRFFTWRPDSSKRITRHTGLGLAIVKRIVEGYGGRIEARNVEPHGAEFEVRL